VRRQIDLPGVVVAELQKRVTLLPQVSQ
jgi:hypothetical protein